MTMNLAYQNYWVRKNLLDEGHPPFEIVKYWESDKLSPLEQIIFDGIKSSDSLLDFGAGNNRVRDKMIKCGYHGLYKTLDPSDEFDHDYQKIEEVNEEFSAILFLDVIEHFPLEQGLHILTSLLTKLKPATMLITYCWLSKSLKSKLLFALDCFEA